MSNVIVEFDRDDLYEMALFNAKNMNRLNEEDAIKKANETVKRRENSLREMTKFIGGDRIKYEDHGKSETYTISKNGRKLKLEIGGNQFDGGYMNSKVVE